MLIFFKTDRFGTQPIALLDYTRSDEQYTLPQIKAKVRQAALLLEKPAVSEFLEIYSLNYRVSYSHSGINAADSLKTACNIGIDNAPSSLVNLINLKQYTTQQSAIALESVIKDIVDPKVQFPQCVMILRNGSNTNLNPAIMRNFIIYNTGFSYDSRRTTSTLTLHGAAFSSMVIGLNFATNIQKDLPLVSQLQTSFETTGYIIESDESIQALPAKIEKFYQPSTLNNILSSVAKDYGLFIDIDDNTKIIKIKSLNPLNKPKGEPDKLFCFRGQVPNAKIISNFSVQDYSQAVFETEIDDVKIFDTIIVYDDSDADQLFDNFIIFPFPYKLIKAYQFYIQAYEYMDDRQKTVLKLTATNNWVVSSFKLGAFLENAIYKEQVQ